MTLKFWMLAGGLLAILAAGTAVRISRSRAQRQPTDQLSNDWLAQAQSREEQQPW
jgi:hypothetical protein